MARWLALIALVATANAAFPLPSMRQSIDNGGAGVFEECAVVPTGATGGFKCSNCLDSSCPEQCCFHEFEGSIGTTALFCEIGGCCMRVMNDNNGYQMSVTERLTATGRLGDGTARCGNLKVNTQCPSCAYANLNGNPLLCQDGFGYVAPARNEPYDGTLCSALPDSTKSDVGEEPEDTEVSENELSEGATEGDAPKADSSTDEPKEDRTTKTSQETPKEAPRDKKSTTQDESEVPSGTESSRNGEKKDVEEEEEDEDQKQDEEEEEEEGKEKTDDNQENSSSESTQSTEGSTNKGLIAGATLGSIAAVTGLCLIAMFCCRKRQRHKSAPLPFAPPQIAQGTQPAMIPGKGLTQKPDQRGNPHAELDTNIESMYSPPGSNESWPASPPRVATRRRRQIISPLAPLSRPMPPTPPESEAGEPVADTETDHVDRDVGRVPSERYSDSEAENVDRDFGQAQAETVSRDLGRSHGTLSAPLSSLIPPIVPNFDTDRGLESAPQ